MSVITQSNYPEKHESVAGRAELINHTNLPLPLTTLATDPDTELEENKYREHVT